MASPFKIFRKNQKMALAILTIIAMGGFIVLPTVLQTMGGRGGPRNQTVVTTRAYGDLDQRALYNLREKRQRVLRFLDLVGRQVAASGGRGQVVAAIQRRLGTASNERLVQTWLMANRATDLGLVVDDAAVNTFLSDLFEGHGSAQAVTTILDRMGMSEARLFDLLRFELLAMRFQDIFQVSMVATPPGQRFDYYRRVKQQATIEVAAVPVDRFTDEIADPGDDVLRKFFEDHKQQLSDPRSPQPGFKVPQRIAVEYLKGEYDKIVHPDAVSADEVRKFYEENKEDRYKRLAAPKPAEEQGGGDLSELDGGQESLPGLDESGPFATQIESPPKGEADKKPAPQGPSSQPAPHPPEHPAAPAGQPAAKEKQPAAKKTKPAKKKPADEKPASEKPADDQSSAARRGPFRLTAYGQDQPAEAPAAGKKKAEAPPAETQEKAPPAATAPETEAEKTPPPPPAAGQQEYIPLEQVEPQIRQELAQRQVDALLKPLENQMIRFRSRRIRYEAERAGGEQPSDQAALVELDLARLAEGKGLTVHKTGLLSALELSETDIGKSNVGGEQYTPHAFDSLTMFRPVRSQDDDGNYYLSWKTDQQEERVPKFDDQGVREEVLAAWKRIEARQKAQQEAERLVASAREKDGTLAEAFAGRDDVRVVETEPFSWMVPKVGYQWWIRQMELGQVKAKRGPDATTGDQELAVPMAGNEFMRAVFALRQGEVGVAWNAPRTVAYVVRVNELVPPAETLRSGFFTSIYPSYASAGNNDQLDLYKAWKNSLEADAGLEWTPGFVSEQR